MDQDESEARNSCAGDGQLQFNRPTDQFCSLENVKTLAGMVWVGDSRQPLTA
jgi:hypothetical protein